MSATGDSPLRILVLATTFPARAGDGTPEFVLTLSAALAASGAQVTAVVPRVPGGAANEVIDGVRVRRFAYFPRWFEGLDYGAIMANLRAHPWRILEVPPLMLAFTAAALRQVRRERPDVVHAHWIVPGGLIARLVLAFARVPYVCQTRAATEAGHPAPRGGNRSGQHGDRHRTGRAGERFASGSDGRRRRPHRR